MLNILADKFTDISPQSLLYVFHRGGARFQAMTATT